MNTYLNMYLYTIRILTAKHVPKSEYMYSYYRDVRISMNKRQKSKRACKTSGRKQEQRMPVRRLRWRSGARWPRSGSGGRQQRPQLRRGTRVGQAGLGRDRHRGEGRARRSRTGWAGWGCRARRARSCAWRTARPDARRRARCRAARAAAPDTGSGRSRPSRSSRRAGSARSCSPPTTTASSGRSPSAPPGTRARGPRPSTCNHVNHS